VSRRFSNVPTTRERIGQVAVELCAWVVMLSFFLGGAWIVRAAWDAITSDRP
jgi:hypothetical protein